MNYLQLLKNLNGNPSFQGQVPSLPSLPSLSSLPSLPSLPPLLSQPSLSLPFMSHTSEGNVPILNLPNAVKRIGSINNCIWKIFNAMKNQVNKLVKII